MDKLCVKYGYRNYEILNEVTAKVYDNNKDPYILKLVPENLILQVNSLYIPDIYKIECLKVNQLPNQLLKTLKAGRKNLEYLESGERLCLVLYEYINGFPFWEYFIHHDKVTPQHINKLLKDTYKGLAAIHKAGYYHGDLGMPNNIILEGNIDSWKRAVIIDIEGGKIKNKQNTIYDVLTLAYVMWNIIVGATISEAYDEKGNFIQQDHPMFLTLIENNIIPGYEHPLCLLHTIFKLKPSAEDIVYILKRIETLNCSF
jgi:serine/threonine protein kinase